NPTRSPAATGETKLLRDLTGGPLSSQAGTNPAALTLADSRHSDLDASADPVSGALGGSTDYDPWGVPTTSGTTQPLGHPGGDTERDPGLVNAHARWYNPQLGAFTGRDTVTLAPDPTARTNRYAYANASPLNATDPDGDRATCDDDGGGGTHSCTDQELKD